MRGIADAEEPRAMPAAQPIDAYRQQVDRAPIGDFAGAVCRKRHAVPDPLAKGLHTLFLQLLDRTFGAHAAALPVLAAVDEDEDLSAFETAHGIRRIFRLSRDPKPKNIHRRAELLDGKPCRCPNGRMPA